MQRIQIQFNGNIRGNRYGDLGTIFCEIKLVSYEFHRTSKASFIFLRRF